MNCRNCKYHQPIPGNAHISCHHPETKGYSALFSLVFVSRAEVKYNELKVVGDKYGVEQGWCIWPVNFDPVWIKECSGYEKL